MPRVAAPPGRGLLRLGVTLTPKLRYEASLIAAEISYALGGGTLFFCDTSLFDTRTDAVIWQALLGGRGSMVIVPPVHRELGPWLATHPSHPAAKAIAGKHPAVRFLSYDQVDERERATLAYYVNLLGLRKRLFEARVVEFERTHGRRPDGPEIERLKREVHEAHGPRAYLLARKGAEKAPGPTFYADEILVCLAAMTAIREGREVVILTKDEDVQEQFYKLQWLLDTHYRGMLLADLYAADPLGFVLHPLPRHVPHIEEAFQGDSNVLIERSRQLLDDVLPAAWTPVAISCAVLGDRLTHTTFVAERGMERLLRTKGATGGLNTDRLPGRNCHIWLAPLDVPEPLRRCAAIASDRRLPLQSAPVEIPVLDVQQTILASETLPRVVEFYPELVVAPDAWLD